MIYFPISAFIIRDYQCQRKHLSYPSSQKVNHGFQADWYWFSLHWHGHDGVRTAVAVQILSDVRKITWVEDCGSLGVFNLHRSCKYQAELVSTGPKVSTFTFAER